MKKISLIASAYLFFFISAGLAQEIQVNIDAEGKIKYINVDLEKRLGLFKEYPGFIEARIYRISDTEYSLEVLYNTEKGTARKRTILDETAFKEFRNSVSNRLAETATFMSPDQEGRYSLLTFTTIYSLALYGPLINTIFSIDNIKNTVAIECLAGSAGFFLPFWLTMDRQVTEASSASYIFGTGCGALHGLFISMMLLGNDLDTDNAQTFTSSMVLGTSLLEGSAGFLLSEKMKLSTGQVDNTAAFSLWGMVWAFEAVFLVAEPDNIRTTGTALLAGSLSGGTLGYYMSTVENYSAGDVIVQNLAAVLGAYVPLSVAELAGAKNDRIFVGVSLGGSVTGTAAGYYLIKNKNFSTGQAGLIALGEAAGGLLGAGAAYYFSPGNRGLYLSLSSAGAVAGFSILYYIFHDSVIIPDNHSSLNIRIMPLGLANIFRKSGRNSTAPGIYDHGSDVIPFALIEYRF